MFDLQSNLIESKKRNKKGSKAYLGSIGLHLLIIAFIVFMGAAATHRVDAEKPIHAFLSQGAAPPPPPPPPPPPAASSAKTTPTPTVKSVVRPTFVQPTETPKELPKIEAPTTNAPVVDTTPAEPSQPAGEAGGVTGGVAGGVQGGVVGGQVEGQLGGELGGVVGGKVGGTGTGTEGEGKDKEPAPDKPLRVGGDVKAPTVIRRVEPNYTEVARKGRITGIVIIEAIIDKTGNVTDVRVIKGLPMGLSQEAEEAVKKWKFRPGTLGGEPVPVIFNLTVNFTIDSAK